jgi:hypothetical protein
MTNGLSVDLWVPLTNTVELRVMNEVAFAYRGSRGLIRSADLRRALQRTRRRWKPRRQRSRSTQHHRRQFAIFGRSYRLFITRTTAARPGCGSLSCANVANLLLARSVARAGEFRRTARARRRSRTAGAASI